MYRALADAVLVLHAAFVLFAVGGVLLVWRRPRVAWLHLLAVAWGVGIEWSGAVCPLTPLETVLRRLAGEMGPEDSFIEHYVLGVLYPDGLTSSGQFALGAVLLAFNVVMYLWLWGRLRVSGCPGLGQRR